MLWGVASASAALPPAFTSFPDGGPGSGGDQLNFPSAIAADPDSGHLYVAERENQRISEFTAWGEFVKAWGWGVVASGPGNDPQNEIQEISVEPAVSAGTFKLSYLNAEFLAGPRGEAKTVAISHDATATAVREAIEGLPLFVPGDVSVAGASGGPWTVEFVGRFADADVAPLAITDSALTGGVATSATVQQGGNFEVCRPTLGDVCRSGQAASELPGQIFMPRGLAVDPGSGSLYVYEGEHQFLPTLRVQKFDPISAEFQLMFGGEVNRSDGTNVCPKADVEAGDVCRGGKLGTADGYFTNILGGALGVGGNIAVDGGGTVYVGDKDRIQKFSSAGVFSASLPMPESGETKSLAFDSVSAALYLTIYQSTTGIAPEHPNVHKLNAGTGTVLAQLPIDFPLSVAPDPLGNVYVVAQRRPLSGQGTEEVIEFDAAGNPVIPLGAGFDPGPASLPNGINRPGLAVNDACNAIGIYALDGFDDEVDAYGPTPDPAVCPPPMVPPSITDQFASEVGTDRAVVRARINPRFWVDTRFYVQYGTSDCGLGGCTKQQPLPPGIVLPGAGVSADLPTPGVTLSGLQPDTKYHFRFVAQSGGGGPVFGVGGAEADATFTTRAPAGPLNTSCPNQPFRTGPGARLPDCRAYEMVSPVDKGEGNAIARIGGSSPASLNQSAADGGRFTFSSYRSFGNAEASTYSTQYFATRTSTGWGSTAISPPNGPSLVNSLNTLSNEFLVFSPDLCTSWFRRISDPPLTGTAPPGFANLYRRQNCVGSPGYAAMINGTVENSVPKQFFPELQGLSRDGQVAVYRARGKLTDDASETFEQPQVYADVGGNQELVSFLPGGEPSPIASTVGSQAGLGFNRSDAVSRAVSADGSRIYWTAQSATGSGQIYVRVGGTETKPVSETISAQPARFLTAAEDGSVAYFTIGTNLYEYDLAAEDSELVAGGVPGVLGANADASRLYFVSSEALAAGADAGAPNLYLSDQGELTFVAALSPRDVQLEASSPTNRQPFRHLARVNEDGLHVAFMSSSSALSDSTAGYDNRDANSGEPDAQVYLYDAVAGQLRCISCDPTEARPAGREIFQGFTEGESDVWASAEIPGWTTQFYPSRVLSEDGRRLFFQSYMPLSGEDRNGVRDVYQWEAPGKGDCTVGSDTYVAQSDGCVSLISTGTSPEDSEFVDASADGADVFFLTESSLVAKDPGLIDVYDARIGGGIAEPPPPADCVGEGCQPLPQIAPQSTPATPDFRGAGNPRRAKGKKCPKGKHAVKRKGKSRCVKNGKSPKRDGKSGTKKGSPAR